jgi:hypothetical protein
MVLVGGIALNKIETWTFIESNLEDESIPDQFSQEVETGYGISHGPLLQGVIDALQINSIDTLVSVDDAVNTARVVHALYKSDEDQCWIKLKDKPVSKRLGK